jgi:hypothetical protein
MRSLVYVSLLAMFVVGCGSGRTAEDAGSDGSADVDGQAPAAPTDGAAFDTAADGPGLDHGIDTPAAPEGAGPDGGGGGGDPCLGACLEGFLSQCSDLGQTCTEALSTGQKTTCYANGVRKMQTQGTSPAMGTVKKADGSVCMHWVLPTNREEDITDGAGAFVARIRFLSPVTRLEVTCHDGSVTQTDLTTPVCAAHQAATMQMCALGACAW